MGDAPGEARGSRWGSTGLPHPVGRQSGDMSGAVDAGRTPLAMNGMCTPVARAPVDTVGEGVLAAAAVLVLPRVGVVGLPGASESGWEVLAAACCCAFSAGSGNPKAERMLARVAAMPCSMAHFSSICFLYNEMGIFKIRT